MAAKLEPVSADPLDALLTVRQVAKRLAICQTSARQLVAMGIIRSRKTPGGHYRVSEGDLQVYRCVRAIIEEVKSD